MQLLEDERQAFTERVHIVALCHVGLGTFYVVEDGKQLFDHFFSAVEHQIRMCGHAMFAEVGKVGGLTQNFFFQFCDFGLSCCELLFHTRSGVGSFLCCVLALRSGGLGCALGCGNVLNLFFGLSGIEVLFFHNCMIRLTLFRAISVPKEGQSVNRSMCSAMC